MIKVSQYFSFQNWLFASSAKGFFGALSLQALYIYLSVFIVTIGLGIIGPILPQFALTFNVSYTVAGVAIASYPLARIVVDTPAGKIADILGRKKPMIAGLALVSLGSLLCGVASDIYQLIIFRFIQGIGSALFVTAAMVYIADIAPVAKRAKYLSYLSASFWSGIIIGPVMGSLLAEMFGIRAPFYALSLMALTSLLFFSSMIREVDMQSPHEDKDIKSKVESSGLRSEFSVVCLNRFISSLTSQGIRTTMIPIYALALLQLSLSDVGLILSVAALVTLSSLFLVANRADTIGKRRVIMIGFSILALSIFLLSRSFDLLTMTAAAAVFGIGPALVNPPNTAIVAGLMLKENRGVSMGLYRTVGDIGAFSGPLVVGLCMDNLGPASSFYVISIFCLCASALSYKWLDISR